MNGTVDISKALKVLHEAARYEFSENNTQRGIDILNNARILEDRTGFKNQAVESMLEIADAYCHLNQFDLALWFVEEAMDRIPANSSTNALRASHLLEMIHEKTTHVPLHLP